MTKYAGTADYVSSDGKKFQFSLEDLAARGSCIKQDDHTMHGWGLKGVVENEDMFVARVNEESLGNQETDDAVKEMCHLDNVIQMEVLRLMETQSADRFPDVHLPERAFAYLLGKTPFIEEGYARRFASDRRRLDDGTFEYSDQMIGGTAIRTPHRDLREMIKTYKTLARRARIRVRMVSGWLTRLKTISKAHGGHSVVRRVPFQDGNNLGEVDAQLEIYTTQVATELDIAFALEHLCDTGGSLGRGGGTFDPCRTKLVETKPMEYRTGNFRDAFYTVGEYYYCRRYGGYTDVRPTGYQPVTIPRVADVAQRPMAADPMDDPTTTQMEELTDAPA
jgi:hypothetical protein